MTKLQELTEKICQLLDGTDLQVQVNRNSGMYNAEIREAHVLMALGESTNQNNFTAIDYSGNFIENYCGEYENSPYNWILGKTVNQQSKETINFLHKILVR